MDVLRHMARREGRVAEPQVKQFWDTFLNSVRAHGRGIRNGSSRRLYQQNRPLLDPTRTWDRSSPPRASSPSNRTRSREKLKSQESSSDSKRGRHHERRTRLLSRLFGTRDFERVRRFHPCRLRGAGIETGRYPRLELLWIEPGPYPRPLFLRCPGSPQSGTRRTHGPRQGRHSLPVLPHEPEDGHPPHAREKFPKAR